MQLYSSSMFELREAYHFDDVALVEVESAFGFVPRRCRVNFAESSEADGLAVYLDGAAGEEDGWDPAGFPFDLSGREEGFDEPAEVEEVGGGGVSGGP